MAILYVNGATGNDSTNKASNTSGTPWQTIGRAAWGNASRSSPSSAQAAAAGDTVIIAAGTYTYSGTIDNRFSVVYNPTNAGSVGNYITFQANGVVVLGAPAANSPVIGADNVDYIKWYADVTTGARFQITCDGRGGTTADDKGVATVVNPRPDTGPVVGHDATGLWIEGCVIDGGPQLDYTDNYDGIHLDGCDLYTIRNNTCHSFRNLADTSNAAGIKLYQSPDGLVEHNLVYDCGGGICIKDTGSATMFANDAVIRYNWVEDINIGVSMSLSAEGANDFYQNVIKDTTIALDITGVNVLGLRFFNNTCVGLGDGVYWHSSESPASSGVVVWNNIFQTTSTAINLNGIAMAAETVFDLEHNCYQLTSGIFYTGSDGNRTFANFNSTYTTQHDDSPIAILDDPEFVNAGTEDYRLGPASPCRNLGVHPDTLAATHAGAYITGLEQIGLETARVYGGSAFLLMAVM